MRKTPLIAVTICLTIAASLAGCSSPPHQENTGEFFDNSLITARVKAKLVDDRVTTDCSIKVSTLNGVVYLTGYVNSSQEKKRADTIVSSISGVKAIENSLQIKATN